MGKNLENIRQLGNL